MRLGRNQNQIRNRIKQSPASDRLKIVVVCREEQSFTAIFTPEFARLRLAILISVGVNGAAGAVLTEKLRYCPHIDGLRAVAVISVVLYHLGIDGLPGGFVGVDVFFVISGFLISRIIFDEVERGTFSTVRFYERRARRILPAFFVVTAAVSIAAYAVLLPPELTDFARSLIASVVYSANIYFYATSDYFSPGAENLPLLHYWSLGVEEQFYILFPLAILLCSRYAPRFVASGVALAFALSLAASHVVLQYNPPAAFYLPPFRAYELLLGCLIALPGMRFTASRVVASAATAGGLVLIGVAVVSFSSTTPLPGFAGLVPCIGGALVIWGSEKVSNPAARLLSFQPICLIGKISYPLYLVHWPLLIFATRIYPFADIRVRAWSVLAVSLLLAFLCYKFVEEPIRRGNRSWTRRAAFASGLAATITVASFASVVVVNKGFPARLDVKVQELLGYLTYDYRPVYRSGTCFLRLDQSVRDVDMAPCMPFENGRKAMLWGDSYAAQLYAGLRMPLRQEGYALGMLTASACAPVLGYDNPQLPNCKAFNDFAFEKIVAIRPEVLILAGQYPLTPELMERLEQTILSLRNAALHPIVLANSLLYRAPVPRLAAERLLQGDASPFANDSDLNLASVATSEQVLSGWFGHRQDLKYVSVMEAVCHGHRCPMLAGEIPVHFDTAHLTEEGSILFGAKLAPKIVSQ